MATSCHTRFRSCGPCHCFSLRLHSCVFSLWTQKGFGASVLLALVCLGMSLLSLSDACWQISLLDPCPWPSCANRLEMGVSKPRSA